LSAEAHIKHTGKDFKDINLSYAYNTRKVVTLYV